MSESEGEELDFFDMTEAELRAWVEANPGRRNHVDTHGWTPLYSAVCRQASLDLTLWLLDEKGADVNARNQDRRIPLHGASTLAILNVLIDRGAILTKQDREGDTVLMSQVCHADLEIVARLLQEPSVRAAVDNVTSIG